MQSNFESQPCSRIEANPSAPTAAGVASLSQWPGALLLCLTLSHLPHAAPRGAGLPGCEQFVSSLCWTRAGGAAVASNSQGHLRVLELV